MEAKTGKPGAGRAVVLSSELSRWCHRLATQTTMHTFVLYRYCSHTSLRAAVVAVGIVGLLLLPIYLYYEARSFYSESKVLLSNEWQDGGPTEYPNITICHPLFFSKKKMEEFNVTDEIGSYLLYALNPDLAGQIRFWDQNPASRDNFLLVLGAAEAGLNRLLRRHGLTLPQLYRALAISCEEFIQGTNRLCEIGTGPRDIPERMFGTCCRRLFSGSPPFFAEHAGVCFTSGLQLRSTRAMRTNSIRIWMNVKLKESLNMSVFLLGDKVMQKFSPVYALTVGRDVPAAAVNERPKKSSLDTVQTVAMRKNIVDRSQLNKEQFLLSSSPEECMSEESALAFEERFNLPYTEANCKLVATHFTFEDCSMGELMGLPNITEGTFGGAHASNKRPCLPMDTVLLANVTATMTTTEEEEEESEDSREKLCKKECVRTELLTSTTWGKGNFEPLKRMIRSVRSHNITDFEDIYFTGLELFFETFEYSNKVLYREGLDVFLSRVGGWLGLAMGASIVSLAELIFFAGYLAKIVVGFLQRQAT